MVCLINKRLVLVENDAGSVIQKCPIYAQWKKDLLISTAKTMCLTLVDTNCMKTSVILLENVSWNSDQEAQHKIGSITSLIYKLAVKVIRLTKNVLLLSLEIAS